MFQRYKKELVTFISDNVGDKILLETVMHMTNIKNETNELKKCLKLAINDFCSTITLTTFIFIASKVAQKMNYETKK